MCVLSRRVQAVTASIIFVVALNLFELEELLFLVKVKAWKDLGLALAMFLVSLLLGIDTGLFFAFGSCLFVVVKQTTLPALTVCQWETFFFLSLFFPSLFLSFSLSFFSSFFFRPLSFSHCFPHLHFRLPEPQFPIQRSITFCGVTLLPSLYHAEPLSNLSHPPRLSLAHSTPLPCRTS